MTGAEVITQFYRAFAARDGATMSASYTPDARFSDPVFTDLKGPEVGAMWRMLCARATDLRVVASQVQAAGNEGSAHWEAWYTYSATGRVVHNIIDARFTFRDGRIATHHDRFDLYRWSRQALGLKGLLLGWLPPVQSTIRGQAARALTRYLASEPT